MNIILGSQSPRRRELMAGLDVPFTAINIYADESYPQDLQGGDIPMYIAREKTHAYAKQLGEDDLLITADTIVWLNGQVLGKPQDEQEACHMLRMLSGKTHQVYTGVCMMTQKGIVENFVDRTDVTFKELTDDEITSYVQKYKPLDKAGAYGVQEWIGYVAVTRLQGSYFNVMGFPVDRVYEALKRLKQA
ncbi:MAG: Maf family nucleotide pyrophosphatase [Paludibacteraceae bacterium]|nr:Maf family nucleotide pyrophosphatase [Paludibacteraceae bacterium]